MSKNNVYNPPTRSDAYEAELNRLVAESGPLRAFTDEENLYMAQQMSEGMDKFLRKDIMDKFFAEKELSKIVINA